MIDGRKIKVGDYVLFWGGGISIFWLYYVVSRAPISLNRVDGDEYYVNKPLSYFSKLSRRAGFVLSKEEVCLLNLGK